MQDNWTEEDFAWLRGHEISFNLDKGYIEDVITDKINDEEDVIHDYGQLIKTAVPELEEMTDRDALFSYLRNEEDLQALVLDYMFARLKTQIPALLPSYRDLFVDDGDSQVISDEDIELCIFKYVNDLYRRHGIFDTDTETIFEDGGSLTDSDVREAIVDDAEFFLRYRRIPNNETTILM
jgi:hypothetical protein